MLYLVEQCDNGTFCASFAVEDGSRFVSTGAILGHGSTPTDAINDLERQSACRPGGFRQQPGKRP